jgi:hypothetical protein
MYVHTQDVELWQPLCDPDILRLPRQSISFPLPENSLWQLGERLQERLSLIVWKCVGSDHRTHAEVDNSMFCSIKELLNILQ